MASTGCVLLMKAAAVSQLPYVGNTQDNTPLGMNFGAHFLLKGRGGGTYAQSNWWLRTLEIISFEMLP